MDRAQLRLRKIGDGTINYHIFPFKHYLGNHGSTIVTGAHWGLSKVVDS